jgi:hypothetical protein
VKPSLSRLPSPALVIACVALFVSLGGVSYGLAKGSIDSREIKNNTVRSGDVRNNALRSKDVRNNTLRTFDIRNNEVRGFDIRNSTVQGRDVAFNTLTGNDVAENSLGKVPSAATADTAGTAGTATTAGSVGGVTMRRIAYVAEQGTGFVDILDLGGLRLQAACSVGGDLDVRGIPADANSEVQSSFPVVGAVTFNNLADNEGAGVIGFSAPNGSVLTISGFLHEEVDGVHGTTNDCGFFGIAEAGQG